MKHSKVKNILLKIILCLFTSIVLTIAGFWMNIYIVNAEYSFLLYAVTKTIFMISSIALLLFISFILYKSQKSRILVNITLSLSISIGILIFFECLFTFSINSTNSFNDLSNKIWIKRHFKPINSLGYRDTEPISKSHKKNILVIGDSFVAGHGIKSNEMFTNILKEKINNEYNIFNLGVCGSHTDREYDSLLTYPIKADVIILGYYHNDIESAMIHYNIKPDIANPKDNLSGFSKFIVDNSLFANFIFSGYSRKKISTQHMESKHNDLLVYLDEDMWNYQQSSLNKFYNYCIENNTRLIILFFPSMSEGISFSNALAGEKLKTYCKERNIEFINIYSSIIDIPINKRIVNKYDHHPSAEVNKIIAEIILEII